jgi:hypothetical protein
MTHAYCSDNINVTAEIWLKKVSWNLRLMVSERRFYKLTARGEMGDMRNFEYWALWN